jgi:hypothetical protein
MSTAQPLTAPRRSHRRPRLEPKSGISKGLILGLYIPGNILSALSMAGLFIALQGRGGDRQLLPVFLLTTLLFSLMSGIPWLVMVYKAWAVIQDGRPSQSPGLAVGLLLIPGVSLVWQFFAYYGWMKDYNRYLYQKRLDLPEMPTGLALTMCILSCLSWLPFLGLLCGLVNFVLVILFINATCDGINRLAAAAPGEEEYLD